MTSEELSIVANADPILSECFDAYILIGVSADDPNSGGWIVKQPEHPEQMVDLENLIILQARKILERRRRHGTTQHSN